MERKRRFGFGFACGYGLFFVLTLFLGSILPVVLIPREVFVNETTYAPTLPPVQYARWARTNLPTPPRRSTYSNVAIASDGSIYAVGNVEGTSTFDFGNGVMVTGNSNLKNSLLVKYDSNGIAQWAKTTVSGTSENYFFDVEIGPDGNIYVVGVLNGVVTYNFGNGITLTGSSNNQNVLLIVYNPSGIPQWARTSTTLQSNSRNIFNNLFVSSNGDIYVTGTITDTCNFGNNVLIGSIGTGFQPFLLKYNSSGVAQWATTTVVGSSSSSCIGVSVASDGNIYVSCYSFSGGGFINFGNGVNFTSLSSSGGFLLKYNSNGIPQWLRNPLPAQVSSYYDVKVGLDGNIYVAGYIRGQPSFDFGNGVIITNTTVGDACILVKYNNLGQAQWAKTSRGGSSTSYNSYLGLSIGVDGSVYVAGLIYDQIPYNFDFGNGVILSTNITMNFMNYLIVKYDSSGITQWARTSLSNTTSLFNSFFQNVYAGPEGSVCAVGFIGGVKFVDFGDNVNVTSTNNTNIVLIVKYA